jgi:hypothetical protein
MKRPDFQRKVPRHLRRAGGTEGDQSRGLPDAESAVPGPDSEVEPRAVVVWPVASSSRRHWMGRTRHPRRRAPMAWSWPLSERNRCHRAAADSPVESWAYTDR